MSLKPNAKTELRRSMYKVAVDAEEGRRRREDDMVEIRKSKREESLMKKRREGTQALEDFSPSSDLKSLPDMVARVWSNDPALQLVSTTQIRKLLSNSRSPPIQEVIDSGVVPRFVEFLMKEDNPKIQFQAARILKNIASGTSDQTKVVIDHNAVPIFLQLLASPNDDVREQSAWALGNIAGDSPQCRDLVLRCGGMFALLNQLNEHTKLRMLRITTWTLTNLCRGIPQPQFDLVKPALPKLERLIHSNDKLVLTYSCYALSYLSNGTNEEIQTVIEAGVVPRLVQLLGHPSSSVVTSALSAIGIIVAGDDLQTQFVVNSGALPCLARLLTKKYKRSIKEDACWTISNIAACNDREQIQRVIEAKLIAPLVYLLQNGEFSVKKAAAWAISNAISGCSSRKQIKYMVEKGCVKPLCDLLVCSDPIIITVCLEGLEMILKVGEAEKKKKTQEMNYYARLIDEVEGLEKIEKLQSHDNDDIYKKAVKILERYFEEEDELN